MGMRTVYIRSPLGARVMSQLGAFVANVEQFMEILTVPLYLEDGLTFVVTGEGFEATQGAGTLIVSNRPDGSDINVTQTVDAWSDTSLTFDFDDGGTLTTDGPVWVRVANDAGQTDSAMTQIPIITGIISDADVSPSFGPVVLGVDECGPNTFPLYCGPVFQVSITGGYEPADDFVTNSPGFSIVGQFSGKQVTVPQAAIDGSNYVWTVTSEGLGAMATANTSSIIMSVGYFFSYCAPDTGGYTVCAADPGGWDVPETGTGEDIYLVPTHPLTVQITSPADGATFAAGADVTLDGFAYAAEGEISSGISWYYDDGGGETLIDSGASVLWENVPEGSYTVYARATNAGGQGRYTSITVSLTVLSIDSVIPILGDEAGGARVTIFGAGFSVGTTVEFDGTPATGVTFFDSTTIQCIAPAGAGLVNIDVFDGAQSAQLEDGFEYVEITDIHITNISPTSGPDTGGTSITITGTGFTEDCVVIFGDINGDSIFADNIVVVDDTEITCDAPDWSSLEIGIGSVDVIVYDEITNAADIEIDGFEFT
jgi:hypothetical protein